MKYDPTQQGKARVVKGHYKFEGPFSHNHPINPIMDEHGNLCGVTVRFDMTYVQTYGGEAIFFATIQKGRLLASRCDNPGCSGPHGQIFLPFRTYCSDCLEKTSVIDITDLANQTARAYACVTNERAGAMNRLGKPIRFISVQIDGVCTMPMGYLLCGEPKIGMRIVPIFQTNIENPSYTIIDLAWVPEGTKPEELPEGFTFAKTLA